MIRIGKLGIERRTGKDMKSLRTACLYRDGTKCRECGVTVWDHLPDYHPQKYDMAHIKSRGAGGSDVLENVKTLCHQCHMLEHGCH